MSDKHKILEEKCVKCGGSKIIDVPYSKNLENPWDDMLGVIKCPMKIKCPDCNKERE